MAVFRAILQSIICTIQIRLLFGIDIVRDFRYPKIEKFSVYWNAPTEECHIYGINFQEYTEKFGIVANDGDKFREGNISILYDPGKFPAMVKNSEGDVIVRNGGIPQLGDLQEHLDHFKKTVERKIPKEFSGLGILDFERWRPIFRRNWRSQKIYKQMSFDLERKNHPYLSERKIKAQAKKNFEHYAKLFMETTLKLASTLRPEAYWGYYGFPECFNDRPKNDYNPRCADIIKDENDGIHWLHGESSTLYPSLYLAEKFSANDNKEFVIGKLNEAWRVTSKVPWSYFSPIYGYVRYKYTDSLNFLSADDIYNALSATKQYYMGGVIIWGSYKEVTTKNKCIEVLTYLNETLGPAVLQVKKERRKKGVHDKFT